MHPTERAGDRPRGAVPLAVRWLGADAGDVRAGAMSAATVALENVGTATWRTRRNRGLAVSYHWLDDHGNPIVWDCPRAGLPRDVPPGGRASVQVPLRAPMPPGRYVLAFDLLEEHEFWLSELGVPMLHTPVNVLPRLTERRLAVVVHQGPGAAETTRRAIADQLEPLVEERPTATAHLVAGCIPPPDWSRRILDAHDEGFAAVGPAVTCDAALLARRRWRWLEPWAPTGGRNPRFTSHLLLPSLVAGLEPEDLRGWPAVPGTTTEPWDKTEHRLFDGRIVVRLRPRSGRPPA